METGIKRIFVVDGCLRITSVRVRKSKWEKNKIFVAKIGEQPIIVLKHGWNKLTTYAGFATKKGAVNFKKFVQKTDRVRQREERQQRKAV